MATAPNSTTTARSTLDSLRVQIENSRVDGLDPRGFVLPSSLSTIFNSTAVAAAVSELRCTAEDRLGLADAIRRGGIPTFAILVAMSQPDLVVNFRKKRCLDRLPLDVETARRAAGDFGAEFVRRQWEFLPYHFGLEQDVEFDQEVLPFVGDRGLLGSGGFGDIRKLEIHPWLQNFAPHDVGY